ncbi:MAG: hypothetical protein AAF682_32255 [Planctomycetota bacterium]
MRTSNDRPSRLRGLLRAWLTAMVFAGVAVLGTRAAQAAVVWLGGVTTLPDAVEIGLLLGAYAFGLVLGLRVVRLLWPWLAWRSERAARS